MADSTVVNLERRGTRTRGGQTRQKILDATLRVIAREGVRGTTHRAIASEADVQLSLTTYYFKDLNELISLAFRSFMDGDYGALAEQWQKAFKYLDQFSPDDLADSVTRGRIIDYCTKLHRRRLLRPVISFCEYFNPTDPETDANLLFGTITRLEYEALTSAPDDVDYKSIRNEIRRICSPTSRRLSRPNAR
jgi:AcrR family transcriptional regulator